MTGIIARKELREMLRDGRLAWAGGIVLGLVALSLLMGWRHYRGVTEEQQAARAAVRRQWLEQGAKHPHAAAHYGTYAFKPLSPLALVDKGIESFTGAVIYLEPHRQNGFRYKPAQDTTAVGRFGQLTAALALQALVPLLIVLLSFSAFPGEQEQGTLRQLLSLGVGASDLAWGKLAGVGMALGLVLAPAVAVGAAALLAAGVHWSADMALRAALLGLVYAVGYAAFAALALAVSAWARSSRMALVVLLGVWILNTLVAPRAAADAAARMAPAGSAYEFTAQAESDVRNGIDGHDPYDRRRARLQAEVLARYGAARVEDLPVNFAGVQMVEAEKHSSAVYQEHYRRLWDIFDRQDRLSEAAALAAPMAAVRRLSMSLAGTDFAHYRHFATAAEAYRMHMAVSMAEYYRDHSRYGDLNYTVGPEVWRTLPDFTYREPSAAWALRQCWPSAALLAAWAAGSLGLMLLAARGVKPW
jgi:ABC-2 type transport system permease protein